MTLSPAPDPDGGLAPRRAEGASRLGRYGWEPWALAVLSLAALVLFLLVRTYPSYDGYYSLVWAREIAGGHLPDFQVPAAPTEHPLALVLGLLSLPFGGHADRAFVFFSVAGFVGLVSGVYALASRAFSTAVGVVAGLIVLTRVDLIALASRGFVDVPFLALVTWAGAMVVRSPRRGWSVYVLLALAGLLRPEAWLFAAVYWVYRVHDQPWRQRLLQGIPVVAPALLWFGLDWIVTGDPLYSLTATRDLASELGRSRSLGGVILDTPILIAKTVKLSVLIAGVAGWLFAIIAFPRRAAVPIAMTAIGIITFWTTSGLGLSVNVRYLSVPSVMLCVGAGVAVAGWTVSVGALRKLGIAVAVLAAGLMIARLPSYRHDVERLHSTVVFVRRQHDTLVNLLTRPPVAPALARCGVMTVPSHQNVPIVRDILRVSGDRVVPSTFQSQPPTHGLVLLSKDPRFRVQPGPVGRDNPWSNAPSPGFSVILRNRSWRLLRSGCD